MLFERQKYQEDCVNNIVNIIDKGIDFYNNDYSNFLPAVQKHYDNNHFNQFKTYDKRRLDVIMETGTGKTFTYIKSIFEINRKFGLNKFIIIVPRKAIRLGVIQNIQLTDEFFYNEYKKHINIINYPDDGLSKIHSDFLNSDSLSVLLLTHSAFNKKTNNINEMPESGSLFKYGSTWNAIANIKPIVIIDEPHLLKGTQTTLYLNSFKDSLFLRFGATFPNDADEWHHLSNVAYSLDSMSSFNEYLVKKIRVNTLFTAGEEEGIKILPNTINRNSFEMVYQINQAICKAMIKKGQDIGSLTGINSFAGIHPTRITKKIIYLSNGVTINIENDYVLSDDEIREMIRHTIITHFEKEEALFTKNVKALSLFFIPNINDFRGDNAHIKKIFEEEYISIRNGIYSKTKNKKYKEFLDTDFNDGKLAVHEGYFSGDKGTVEEKEASGIDLILNKKEELLSFDTNLRFIFSVWALQEGWDNPNVCNICKISSTSSDTSRRQQVGRGLRIAVNQNGRRLTYNYLDEKEGDFYDINTLDIFVSGKEAEFIEEIQREISEASFSFVGDIITTDILISKGLNSREANVIINKLEEDEVITYNSETDNYSIKSSISEYIKENRDKFSKIEDDRFEQITKVFTENRVAVEDGNKKPHKVKIRKNKLKEFKELWEAINRKVSIVYKKVNEDILIDDIVNEFNAEEISTVTMKIQRKEYNSQEDTIITIQENTIGETVQYFHSHGFETFVQRFISNSNYSDDDFTLPLNFMIKLLNHKKLNRELILNNPKRAEELLKQIMKDEIHKSIIQSIDYKFETEVNITPLHIDESLKYHSEIESSKLGKMYTTEKVPKNLLYDTIVYDSNIEKDIQQLDPAKVDEKEITVFAKLPSISIPTPYKAYNPDFAYLINRPGKKTLFLVVESKGYKSDYDIPEQEMNKITYGQKFFKRLQKEMPNIQIEFRTRINQSQLIDILKDIEKGA